MKTKTVAAFLITLSVTSASAQNISSPNTLIEEIITEAAESDNDEILEDAISTAEYLQGLMQNRININTASQAELQQIPFISNQQIIKIEEYRKQNGAISNMGELKAIYNQSHRNLLLYNTFLDAREPTDTAASSISDLLATGRHSLILSGKSQTGAENPSCALRYRYNSQNRIAWGITAENDMDERFQTGNQKYGFDYYSAFMKIGGYRILKQLILGDYTARFGEGLILGQGMGMGKSMQTAAMSASERTIHEHTSCNEYSYYRGAAACVGLGNVSLTTYISRNLCDATSHDSTTFQNLKTTGYHRTPKEINSKNNLLENHLGIMAHYSNKYATIGAAIHYFGFDKTYTPSPEMRNRCIPSIKNGCEYSISYKLFGKYISLCGETAIDGAQKLATLHRLDVAPQPTFRLRLMQRLYSKGYHAFRASAMSSGSHIGNEAGYYIGAIITPGPRFQLEAYTDIHRFPWITTKAHEPSSGEEIMALTRLALTRNASLRIKAKSKSRQISPDTRTTSAYISPSLQYSPTAHTTLSTSAQWTRYTENTLKEKGYLIIQDLHWQGSGGIMQLTVRYSIFSAPYNARAYSQESDVSYIYSIPAYYNSGTRYYIMATAKASAHLRIQARLSQWNYQATSQGPAHRKNEISIAIRYDIQ